MFRFLSYPFLIGIALLFSFTAGYGQTNSVELQDGSGNVLSTHASITNAYAAIPLVLTQAYVIELTQNYDGASEVFPIAFIAKTGASPVNTITVRPAANVSSITLTAVVSGNALIRLDDADYVIIDGSPGGLGNAKALTLNNQGTSTSSSGIHLINGACHNLIRYCNIGGYSSLTSGGRGVYIQTSASNPSGNSDNRFEFLTINGPRYYINSVGTSVNPNRNLYIFGCEFVDLRFAGWWQQAGTGKVTLDSNLFYCNVPSGTSSVGSFAILSDFQSDSIIIHRNKIYNMDNSTYNTDVCGMIFRSFNPGSYVHISNNFISLTAPNIQSDVVRGIEFGTNSANNPVEGKIYFNTVRIGGTSSATSPGALNSAALCFDATNAGSNFDIQNNVFINERTGGIEQHVAVALLTNNGTINCDNNTYFSASPDFARLIASLLPDFSTYQAAVFPQEASSNTDTVFFVSNTDLHITGTSIGNTNLYGVAIPGITTDIDNETRVIPYRGADEVVSVLGCSGTPVAGILSGSATDVCPGDSIMLMASGHDTGTGISYQWQAAPAGTGLFINIPGANDTILTTTLIIATDYRMIDSCDASGLTGVSDTFTVTVTPFPTVSAINMTNSGLVYNFSASGTPPGVDYLWDFGDSNTDTIANPSHTYMNGGTYTVTLIVSNACGSDTISTSFTIPLTGLENNTGNTFLVFPNPANDWLTLKAPGDEGFYSVTVVSITGAETWKMELGTGTPEYLIPTSSFAPGFYILKIGTKDGIISRPFQVIHP